jgi:regulator of protease activity HflC (stomatin/prohibitin superfamily)
MSPIDRWRDAQANANDRGDAVAATIGVGVVIILFISLIWFLVWEAESFDSTDGGHVAVVRNGGPFDNTKIRQVLDTSSGRTNIGMFSDMHNYPTSQRFFTIDSTGGGDSDDVVTVPTADGVNVGIEGTAYFTLNTTKGSSWKVLKDFDNKYGTRTFKCSSGGSKHVYDGDNGFSCFLDQIVSPVINNDLRVSIGDLRCADLVSSCSLVQNTTTTGTATIDPNQVGKGNLNLGKIETDISTSLQDDLNQTLGGNYLQVERFNLAKVDLPKTVQDAIDTAQSNFTSVTQAQADQKKQLIEAATDQKKALIEAQTRLQQATVDAQANDEKQAGYNKCPACQQIDILKALPQGITVYAPGNGSGVSLAVPAK